MGDYHINTLVLFTRGSYNLHTLLSSSGYGCVLAGKGLYKSAFFDGCIFYAYIWGGVPIYL